MTDIVIYEVNIKITKSIFNEYIVWLKSHLQDMLVLDGFKTVKVYSNHQDDQQSKTKSIVVKYEVQGLAKLQDYFNGQAKQMRKATSDLFGDDLTIVRRVLEELDISKY